ncbi:cytochrome P460 family protein [Granulicella tundricola]|uniref:Haem-binding domain-containing protein n=1 Tax=Granulicella tundricola (strain ATCC BAA-1859 / DSM 23138 / MP5ACTX9) TaxID=1198114 RepID=E8X5P5_GRATM|nr:cytochrome P460 family protein [Granulicella tundricola]ADW70672.1 hypothetical protein AciX9_3671 [Granulicella tundricola MP5ACTX9]
MKILGQLLLVGVVVFVLLQAVRPSIPAPAATAELQAPPQVMQVLRKDCYSCHSNERRLAWFDEIVPGYWLVRHDILTAREHVNFSTIGAKPAAMQKATLFEAVNMIQLGAMPLPQFTALHPDAKVTPEELSILKAYLAPWSPVAPAAPKTDAAVTAPAAALVSLTSVLPEFDGFTFDGSFEGWKPLSTTDRGDNNTFRFILGNEIAVKAAQSGNISPWPDGAQFAKVAWQQEPGADGLVHPGKFVQVELMRKDAQRYKNQEGWGWGRWRGMDLKPYGKDAKFVNECTSCHQPVKGDDYVYTMPITPAKVAKVEVVNNHAAALPASLPYQPLGWNAITMYVDPKTHTMATLYGNDAAVKATGARGAIAAGAVSYPAGAVLALVTWVQRDDPHWFGARIADSPQAVEFVEVGATHAYRRYAGDGLPEDRREAGLAMQRTAFVTGLAPARLP